MSYNNEDFTWAIWLSQEDTVAFAGAIIPKVKALLIQEEAHWNKFEWKLD